MDSWEDDLDVDNLALPSVADSVSSVPDGRHKRDKAAGAGGGYEEEWLEDAPKKAAVVANSQAEKAAAADSDKEPLLIVDFTTLTEGKVHNRFDKFACNDPDLKSQEARRIGADYDNLSRELIRIGVAQPCGPSVWKDALATLRDANPGHFFAPVFPPPRPSPSKA